jgi:hypothetical protein
MSPRPTAKEQFELMFYGVSFDKLLVNANARSDPGVTLVNNILEQQLGNWGALAMLKPISGALPFDIRLHVWTTMGARTRTQSTQPIPKRTLDANH